MAEWFIVKSQALNEGHRIKYGVPEIRVPEIHELEMRLCIRVLPPMSLAASGSIVAAIGKGAKYLRARGPLTLVYQAKIGSRALALKAEHRVKKRQKKRKEQIVSEQPDGAMLIEISGLQKTKDPTT